MKGDFSRETFDPAKHYRAVLMQQGRVQLDADWNEQQAITRHRLDTDTMDLIGPHGAPFHTAGFQLTTDGVTVTIGAGRYYVNGVLCENEAAVAVANQPYLPGAALPAETGLYLAYLEVWQQHVTALDDPLIRDSALGGADTANRLKTVWQVRFLPVQPPDPELLGTETPLPEWDVLNTLAGGMLQARVRPMSAMVGRGHSANAGTRPTDNQLYRVEIHQGGPRHKATFVWSRDNGSVVAGVETIDGNQVVLSAAPYGHAGDFAAGQWVEVSDDVSELTGQPGVLVKIRKPFDPATRSLTLAEAPVIAQGSQHVKLRRWDGAGSVDGAAGWIALEDGIEVRFSAGDYRTGDYWLIPARAATGDIEWPLGTSSAEPAWRPPQGPRVQRSRLALLSFDGGSWAIVGDCRKLFGPMSEPPPLESLQVLDVRPFADVAQEILRSDGNDVSTDILIDGLRVMLNQAIDSSVIHPVACFITINLPFPESGADRQTWGNELIGYRPLPIRAELSALDMQTILLRSTPAIKFVISALPGVIFADSWQVQLFESTAEWAFSPDNSLVVSASPSFSADTVSLCLNRQRIQAGTKQLDLTAMLVSAQGTGGSSLDTGLVFNWIDEGNYWKFVYYEERRGVGVSLVQVNNGIETRVNLTMVDIPQPTEFGLTLSQDAGGLLFRAQLSNADGVATPLGDVPVAISGAPATLVVGSGFGLIANAPVEGDRLVVRFTQFQMTKESGVTVKVVPATQRALARLTVKLNLLRPALETPSPAAIAGSSGADYERWFWLVQ